MRILSRGSQFTLLVLLTAGLGATSLSATSITLGFNTLPSAQGFGYSANCPENTVFSLSGGVLHENSESCSSGDFYSRSNVISPNPFSLSCTVRVTEVLAPGVGYACAALGNGYEFEVGIGVNRVYVSGSTFSTTSVDTSLFHTYLLNGNPADQRFTLWIDGLAVGSGVTTFARSGNRLFFGDPADAHLIADLTALSYSDTPEPRGAGLVMVLLVVLGLWRHRAGAEISRSPWFSSLTYDDLSSCDMSAGHDSCNDIDWNVNIDNPQCDEG